MLNAWLCTRYKFSYYYYYVEMSFFDKINDVAIVDTFK